MKYKVEIDVVTVFPWHVRVETRYFRVKKDALAYAECAKAKGITTVYIRRSWGWETI